MTEQKQTKNVQQFTLYIESNKEYLQQAYSRIFLSQNSQNMNNSQINSIKPQTKQSNKNNIQKLSQFPLQRMIQFLFEIFSLGQRYSNNKKTKQIITKSIDYNIKSYKNDNQDKVDNDELLTFQILLEILIYIIQRNGLFAVQYQTSNKNNKQLNQTKQLNVNIDISDNNLDQSQQKQKQINNKMKNSFLMQQIMMNQFQLSSQILKYKQTPNKNIQLIKKNTKIIFDFYCRQQMELGGVLTFDRLSQQTSSMSLGKFLIFAKATNLFNDIIKRQKALSIFKKVSQGNKTINFDKFQFLITQFQNLDTTFYQRMGLLSENIRKTLKYIKSPFNTKDKTPRQQIAVRNFQKKLTGHSGKTGESLQAEIEVRKNEQRNLKKLQQIKSYLKWKNNRPELISQNDLNSLKPNKTKIKYSQLSFIGSIIHPQQQDSMYLKDHLIPRLQKPTQKVSKFGKIFETERYQSLDKLTLRKQSVITEIKKRVKQVQSLQKIANQNNRSLILPTSSLINHKRYSNQN